MSGTWNSSTQDFSGLMHYLIKMPKCRENVKKITENPGLYVPPVVLSDRHSHKNDNTRFAP